MALSFLVLAAALGCCGDLATASSFLDRLSQSTSLSQRILLQQIEGLFGGGDAATRVVAVEQAFAPMYAALPKDEHGHLGHSAVRYALHRYFMQRHAWVVNGLDTNGGLWNDTSAVGILKGRVPQYVQDVFEEHLGERGFGLHELAVFAVAFEHIVRAESSTRIEAAYEVLGLQTSEVLTVQQVHHLLDTSFVIHLFEMKQLDLKKIRRILDNILKYYPGWKDTQAFLRDSTKNHAFEEQSSVNPFSEPIYDFHYVLRMAEYIHDRYGHFQDLECRELKDVVLAHEYKGTGRVPLSDFYGMAIAGDWRFGEKLDYLRSLGAVDDSDPSALSVIVPNYMYGKSMCLASSSYYSVCCLDECEGLLSHIERKFAAPEAFPSAIAAEVAKLSSSTVSAPRNLSATLLRRLDDIAATHDGMVPFHSRLFSQFMSHAFPRECAYPHVAGTTNPQTQREYYAATGQKTGATQEELAMYGKAATPLEDSVDDEFDSADFASDDFEEPSLWTDEEELVVVRKRGGPEAATGTGWRAAMMILAVGAMVVAMFQTFQSAKYGAMKAAQISEGKVFV